MPPPTTKGRWRTTWRRSCSTRPWRSTTPKRRRRARWCPRWLASCPRPRRRATSRSRTRSAQPSATSWPPAFHSSSKRRSSRMRALAIALALTVGLATSAAAQAPASSPGVTPFGMVTGDTGGVEGIAAADQAAPVATADPLKRGEFVVAPMPIVNPTLENGLSFVAGYLYRIDADDAVTAPSRSGVAGFKTSNGSWGAAALQSLHLGRDRFRLLGLMAYADVNYKFYGIGGAAGASGESIELNQVGPVGVVEGLIRVAPNWYIGARYQILSMTVSTESIALPGGPTLPAQDADIRTAALGPRVHYDSRDNPFYPRRGMQIQGVASFYDDSVGGNRTYQGYQGWINRYSAVGARHVFAWHAGACGVAGSVPFYDLCMLGK